MDQLGPCPIAQQYMTVHVIVAAMTSFTAILTTWLTVRAKRKDREEKENGNSGAH